MKAEDIKMNDWLRILIGDVPISFFIELVIRAIVIYLILMLSMRLMGKRMSSQLSRNELAALVSLAAAIGVPMMAPDRGLLPAVVIAIVLIAIERVITKIAFKNQRFEKYSQGNISMLIKDGVIDIKVLKGVRLAPERLCAQLRSQGITQLGKVRRFYMEASGSFTLIENEQPFAGLSVLPLWDKEFINCFEFQKDKNVCTLCGYTKAKPIDQSEQCPNCGKDKWLSAVKDKTTNND